MSDFKYLGYSITYLDHKTAENKISLFQSLYGTGSPVIPTVQDLIIPISLNTGKKQKTTKILSVHTLSLMW